MNGPLLLELAKIIGAIVGLVAGALVTYWRFNERRRTKELNLDENPERCGKHEIRLDALERRMGSLEEHNREDHNKLFNQIGAVGNALARLGGRFNGGKGA